MKLLEIDCRYYKFPAGVNTLEDFISYLSDKYNSFIPMDQYQTDNCVFPYFILDDVKTVYINVSQIDIISETEGEVLSREEYDCRLDRVVRERCVDCVFYEEATEKELLEGHRNMISLDGECIRYEKKQC